MPATQDETDFSPPSFELRREMVDGICLISVRGELDLDTAPQLDQLLTSTIASSYAAVAIDLAECEFIDSTGIAVIVKAWHEFADSARDSGSDGFVLCSPSGQVRRVLDITGLPFAIATHESREEAIAALRARLA
jgi:stage II sporulation protein AA (anti-sigma F factor antagonist)